MIRIEPLLNTKRAAIWPPFEVIVTGSPIKAFGDDAQRHFDVATPMPFSLSLACAAASLAIGTRKGEQLT